MSAHVDVERRVFCLDSQNIRRNCRLFNIGKNVIVQILPRYGAHAAEFVLACGDAAGGVNQQGVRIRADDRAARLDLGPPPDGCRKIIVYVRNVDGSSGRVVRACNHEGRADDRAAGLTVVAQVDRVYTLRSVPSSFFRA